MVRDGREPFVPLHLGQLQRHSRMRPLERGDRTRHQFTHAKFTGHASFDWAAFTGGVSFDTAKFTDDVSFDWGA